jgi:hypothetical protein
MIRYLPENNKLGDMRPEEKGKWQVEAMPEMATPVEVKPGKIIMHQELLMLRKKCLHRGTGRQEPRYRNDTMKLIQ